MPGTPAAGHGGRRRRAPAPAAGGAPTMRAAISGGVAGLSTSAIRTRGRCTHLVERAISASTRRWPGRCAARRTTSSSRTRGLREQPVDDGRVRVRQQALHRVAVGPAREGLALPERQRAALATIEGTLRVPRLVPLTSAARNPMRTGCRIRRSRASSDRRRRLLPQPLHHLVHPLAVQRVDDGQRAPRATPTPPARPARTPRRARGRARAVPRPHDAGDVGRPQRRVASDSVALTSARRPLALRPLHRAIPAEPTLIPPARRSQGRVMVEGQHARDPRGPQEPERGHRSRGAAKDRRSRSATR